MSRRRLVLLAAAALACSARAQEHHREEAPTVDAIAAWMLKRPFRKEID